MLRRVLMYTRNTWDATDVIRTIVVFSFTLLCYFLSAMLGADLRHFYEPVSFWLDDRLTREFTYLYMSSRDSIFIKIVQFIQGSKGFIAKVPVLVFVEL